MQDPLRKIQSHLLHHHFSFAMPKPENNQNSKPPSANQNLEDSELKKRIIPAIMKHNNGLFCYILSNKMNELEDDELFSLSFQNKNISLAANLIKEKYILDSLTIDKISHLITASAASGYYTLTRLFFDLIFNLNNKKIDDPVPYVYLEDSV